MSELRPAPAPPASAPGRPRASWFARRRIAAVNAASARIHASLLDQVVRGQRPSASTGTSRSVLALSVLVLAAYAAAVALLAVATFASKNLYGWFGVVLGWLVLFATAPRPNRLEDAQLLTADESPGLHRHVAAVATAVGAPTPHAIAVSTEWSVRMGVSRHSIRT